MVAREGERLMGGGEEGGGGGVMWEVAGSAERMRHGGGSRVTSKRISL